MRVSLLTIGDELLIGQVTDTNAAWIGRYLTDSGVTLVRSLTVGDALDEIVAALRVVSSGVDAVLVTGGLGPTRDDLTLEALARFLGVELEFNEQTYARIRHIFEDIIRRPMSASHRTQAMQPAGAKTLLNEQGTAPGIVCEQAGRPLLVAMPGVPREMKYLMQAEVVPLLLQRFPGVANRRVTIHTSGWGETQLEHAIADVEESLPAGVTLAYLPSLGTVRLRVTAKGEDADVLEATLQQVKADILGRVPAEIVFGFDDTSLVAETHRVLIEAGATVATAESCTGGKVAHTLVEHPGASAFFVGGLLAYDNGVKVRELGVEEATLAAHGAVSEQTVRAMVAGAIARLGVSHAVATSGIAGPSGGTAEKPVGTIYVAAGDAHGTRVRKLSLGRDRATNIAYTAVAAVDVLRRYVLYGPKRDS